MDLRWTYGGPEDSRDGRFGSGRREGVTVSSFPSTQGKWKRTSPRPYVYREVFINDSFY